MPESLAYAVLGLSVAVLSLLLPFACHRAYLLYLSRRPAPHVPDGWSGAWPAVTVQLPLFNEAEVAARLIDAACNLDYPRDELEIQVLDDSTDETPAVVATRVAYWRSKGVDIRHIRREDRTGFKAGALAEGVRLARGEFMLVLDSDFVTGTELVKQLLPAFSLPDVGMVQARWDHLNERDNWWTRAQSLLLDGHFFLEQGGRYRGGRFFNFNGTAGMWRRSCLEDAGGWQADTLTEDLDLSYRAQMRGWRFVFLEDVGVPAELPDRVGAFEIQQKRWAQGGIQTAIKLLPALLRGPWPRSVKAEAVIHLCGHLAHPLTLMLGLLIYPAAVARRSLGLEEYLFLDLVVFTAATVPFVLFYAAAGRKRRRPWPVLIPDIAVTLATGIGLTVPVSRAILRGVSKRKDPFVRTPKKGDRRLSRSLPASLTGDTLLKLLIAVILSAFIGASVNAGLYASLPFLLLFASGYWSLGMGGLVSGRRSQVIEREQDVKRHPEDDPGPKRLGPVSSLQGGAETPVSDEYEAA